MYLDCGSHACCVILENGEVKCWGGYCSDCGLILTDELVAVPGSPHTHPGVPNYIGDVPGEMGDNLATAITIEHHAQCVTPELTSSGAPELTCSFGEPPRLQCLTCDDSTADEGLMPVTPELVCCSALVSRAAPRLPCLRA